MEGGGKRGKTPSGKEVGKVAVRRGLNGQARKDLEEGSDWKVWGRSRVNESGINDKRSWDDRRKLESVMNMSWIL